MTLNLQAKDSYHVFDEFGMLIIPSDELSWRDSVGRTVLSWIAYGMPEELLAAINKCVDGDEIEGYTLKRHPNHKEIASRDHYSYWIILNKLYELNGIRTLEGDIQWLGNWFKNFINTLPRMRGLYLWMHSLTGNKLAERLYYLIYTLGALIGNIWLRICRCAGRIGPERDNSDWIKKYWQGCDTPPGELVLKSRTLWQKLWAWIIFQTMPAYTLHNKAWQIHVMPDSERKERLKRILLKRVGKSNIMLRLLFGERVGTNCTHPVTQQEVDAYPNMTNFRPGVYLDETCRRTIRELTEVEAKWNTFEKDLIVLLYENTK